MFHGWAVVVADGTEVGRVEVRITNGIGYILGFPDPDLAFEADELYLVDDERGERIPITVVSIDADEGRVQVTSP